MISTIVRKVIRKVTKEYDQVTKEYDRYIFEKKEKKQSYFGKEVLDFTDANIQIYRSLSEGKPMMISRFGGIELEAVHFFLNKRHKQKNYPKNTAYRICNNAGVFPNDNKDIDKFAEVYSSSIKNMDILGVWYFIPKEDYYYKKLCPDSNLIRAAAIEPYYSNDPWSRVLEGKKVLVIHPFTDTIKKQYENYAEIFENKQVLPKFELKTIKAVQSIAGTKTEFTSWYDAYEYMCRQIDKTDFDIALIGAGAYGLPLSSYVKKVGKQVVHMGGAVQILFGIKGVRWDTHPTISKLYNKYWVRPSEDETPKQAVKVENGCYW